MMVIGLTNQKGGVGKTTIAVNLAGCLSKKDYRVLLVDADPQGSVLQWQAIHRGAEIDVIHYPDPGSFRKKKIRRTISDYDHLVIDSPPAAGDMMEAVLGVTDLSIVPIGPSPLDIWSSKETLHLIQTAKGKNRSLTERLLITRKIARTRVGKDAREAMVAYNVKIFDTEISQRIAYVEAMISGLFVWQHSPYGEAAMEIDRLCEEVIRYTEV
jgi:chromosome partitioning protein